SASVRTAIRVRPVIRPRLKRLVEGCTVRSFPLVVITAPQVGASCLGISLGPPPARVIARRARLRSSSGQIFAARASVEGQRRVYAPGVTSPLSYARTTACTGSRSPSLASRLETWVLIVPSLTNSSAASSALLLPHASI